MADAPERIDPWDPANLPFTNLWPIAGGGAAGVALAVAWHLLDRPFGLAPLLVGVGAFIGVLAAALAPTGRRNTRFLEYAYPALVAAVTFQFLDGVLQLTTDTGSESGDTFGTTVVNFFAVMFFVGFPVLMARVFQSPARRLPDSVLAQIGEPFPTMRRPILLTVRTADGATHPATVLRGGFVAGVKVPFTVADVREVVDPSQAGRGGSTRPTPKGYRSRRGVGPTDTAMPKPRTSSRTTPKGTQSRAKRPKR